VEKFCIAGQATDDNMVHAHCMLGIPKATNTQSEYVRRIAFPRQQWLHERPQYYVIRTLYVLIHTFAYSDLPVLSIAINTSSQMQDSESLSENTHKRTTVVWVAISRKLWQTVHKNCM
jgi:hypothetical protein